MKYFKEKCDDDKIYDNFMRINDDNRKKTFEEHDKR